MDGRPWAAVGRRQVVVEEEEAAVLGGVGDEAVRALDVEEKAVERGGRVRREEAQAREEAIKAELARQEAARQERERFLQSLPEEISAALKVGR